MKEIHRVPFIDADRLEIDFSAASTYLKCGKQYWFRHVQGLKDPPGIALIEGSSHHKAVEQNNLHKRDKGSDLRPDVLTSAFMSDFRSRVGELERLDWEGEDENKIYNRAKLLHYKYIKEIAPRIQPEIVEEKFERTVTIGGKELTIFGTIDLTETNVVWDYKTTRKAKTQSDVDNSLQLSLYALAAKKLEVGFIQFVKTGNPYVGLVPSIRTKGDLMWAVKVVYSVADAVRRGQFPMADPTSWVCQPKWCGYWDKCRGKK